MSQNFHFFSMQNNKIKAFGANFKYIRLLVYDLQQNKKIPLRFC